MGILGLELNSSLIGPALVLGVAAAGLYGFMAVSLVLTYRVSRTIGFVQGGIAIFCAWLYFWLTFDTGLAGAAGLGGFGLNEARMGKVTGLVVVVIVGALIGWVYGLTVTSRKLATWPRLNLTIYSLAWLLGLVAIGITQISTQDNRVPSVFGDARYRVLDGIISSHQVATLVILVGIIAVLTFVMVRTQTGINIRAIADNSTASRWVGIPLHRVGTGVYAVSGALSAFAGVLLSTSTGLAVEALLTVFLRALTVSVLGGFGSFSLALAGCLLLGVGESFLAAGVFGPMEQGETEMLVMTALFGLVLLINRLRPIKMLEAQTL